MFSISDREKLDAAAPVVENGTCAKAVIPNILWQCSYVRFGLFWGKEYPVLIL